MTAIKIEHSDSRLDIRLDRPEKRNALNSELITSLTEAFEKVTADSDVKVIVLSGNGKDFCSGADLESVRKIADSSFEENLSDANELLRLFVAIRRCPVPVIAMVHGKALAGGCGLATACDLVIASDDAVFGLPEVERGALGAATHLSRLVPQHMMRRLFFTAATVDAATLHQFGSVHEVVPRADLDEAALRVARDIAGKDTRVIRAAKEALNLIDPQRVNASYRMEQGFTFELNLSGVSDELRDDFAGTTKSEK